MRKEIKGILGVVIFLMVIWGLFGLVDGEGFIGGIGTQIDAFGDIVSLVIKIVLIIGVIWFITTLFKKKSQKSDESSDN